MKDRKRAYQLGSLIALGVIYGDIGTSPLYTMSIIVADGGGLPNINTNYLIGSTSLVIWTLLLITTLKYVLIATRVDNHGEGGIFSLYARVKKNRKILLIPALIGGDSILADGTITPAITVTSAVEGIKGYNFGFFTFSNETDVVIIIVSLILFTIFAMQKFGTPTIGKLFGPLMLLWFLFIGLVGLFNILHAPIIMEALNPIPGITFLFSPANKIGILLLGSIFLATTGAEALYADMGHVGRTSIYRSWPLVFLTLALSYLGQGACTISQLGQKNVVVNPFYEMVPHSLKLFSILIATIAAIIASQALITGSFTLINEAIALKLLPRLPIKYPGTTHRQVYIPVINWLLAFVSIGLVWFFRTSQNMSAAYGLAITIAMFMTTTLLYFFVSAKTNRVIALLFLVFFGTIEFAFFIANMVKFAHGGYIAILLSLIISGIMVSWHFGNKEFWKLANESRRLPLPVFLAHLDMLLVSDDIPKYTDNLIYFTKIKKDKIRRSVAKSILDNNPKKADVYWFVDIKTTSNPYGQNYRIHAISSKVICVQFILGYKEPVHINEYLDFIIEESQKAGIIAEQRANYTISQSNYVGDKKAVMLRQPIEPILNSPNIPFYKKILISNRALLQHLTNFYISNYSIYRDQIIIEDERISISKYRKIHPEKLD
ncbi:MAG: KUP/HAK/KT family potassium transporter [Micrococcaceae bacterium]